MSHTPGPWEARDNGLNPLVISALEGAICNFENSTQSFVDRRANARLIAAAPDLFDALHAILEGMEASGGWKGDDELFDAGKRAIRKAEGK